jgi:flavin reductase (DIM6/NTAB) family NADH-FMN oxidoreductase RutF
MATREHLTGGSRATDRDEVTGMLHSGEYLADVFKDAMSNLAAGVVMVTCRLDGRPWGMTASACISVSVSPPTLLVSLANDSSAARAIDIEGRFGISILGQRHIDTARYASAPGAPKFLESFLDPAREAQLRSKTPEVAGALAHVDCDVVERIRLGDHTLFLGRARDIVLSRRGEPLIYCQRAYRALAPDADARERAQADKRASAPKKRTARKRTEPPFTPLS